MKNEFMPAQTPTIAQGANLPQDSELPAFLDDDDDVPFEPHFTHYRTISAQELFDMKPGESVAEAATRKAREREELNHADTP